MPHPYRWRRLLRILGVAAIVLALAALAARPSLERALRSRLLAEGARRGLDVQVDAVRLGLWPPIRLHKVVVEKAGRLRLEAGDLDVWWTGRPRIEIGDAVLRGPAGLTVNAEWTVWDVLQADGDHLRVALARPAN